MKTIKILFNFMRKVKHMCSSLKYGCESCPFYTDKHGVYNNCKVKNLIYSLCNTPSEWDIDKEEREWME